MTPESIPQIPSPDLERPYSTEFVVKWDMVHQINDQIEKINLHRVKCKKGGYLHRDPNHAHIRFGIKAKINIVRESVLKRPNYQPPVRQISDSEAITHPIILLDQTDDVIYINQNKLTFISADNKKVQFKIETLNPVEIEIIDDPKFASRSN